jgi:hypothetical protein
MYGVVTYRYLDALETTSTICDTIETLANCIRKSDDNKGDQYELNRTKPRFAAG